MTTTINLAEPGALTIESVRALLAAHDDSTNVQLRVTKEGIAFISTVVGNRDLEGLAFRFESWQEGTDFVGPSAAQDDNWVGRIYRALKSNWPNPSSRYLDFY